MNGKIKDETELITAYLAPLAGPGGLGLRDDAGLIAADGANDLVVSTDPIIAGVHFFPDDAPYDIAWKALAVNVSDLVAKGAEPFAYTLTLALPQAPAHAWMADFARGLEAAQAHFKCALIGGDTDHTVGVLSVGVTAFGKVPLGRMVKRQAARQGDEVYVSGTVGDAALGLILRRDPEAFGQALGAAARDELIGRYLRPRPDPALAALLRAYASAALDISDGLVQDAEKLARGAESALAIAFADLPLSSGARHIASLDAAWRRAVASGGDDYEVLFAVPPERGAGLATASRAARMQITKIGVLQEGEGVRVYGPDGQAMRFLRGGYDHFAGDGR